MDVKLGEVFPAASLLEFWVQFKWPCICRLHTHVWSIIHHLLSVLWAFQIRFLMENPKMNVAGDSIEDQPLEVHGC